MEIAGAIVILNLFLIVFSFIIILFFLFLGVRGKLYVRPIGLI